MNGRDYIDPELLAIIDGSEGYEKLDIRKLKRGDIIEIQTQDTLYTFELENPEKGYAKAKSTGQLVPADFVNVAIWGTSLTGTGTMVKLNTIIPDMRLVIVVEGVGKIVLSATQKITINGKTVLSVIDLT